MTTVLTGQEWQGVDVYNGQKRIDWAEVAKAGIRFAIVKATEGVDVTDERLRYNAQGAAHQGLELCYYHFGRPDTDPRKVGHLKDAEAEARDFLEAIECLPKPSLLTFDSGRTASVWLDLEHEVAKLDEQQGFEWIQRWSVTVEDKGPLVGFYTNEEWLGDEAMPTRAHAARLLTRKDGSQRALWVARYGANDGQARPKWDPNKKVPKAWGSWDIWQYTSKGTVPGISKPCDRNLARVKSVR